MVYGMAWLAWHGMKYGQAGYMVRPSRHDQGSRCPAPSAPNAQKNFIWPDFFSFGANVWRILFSPTFLFFSLL